MSAAQERPKRSVDKIMARRVEGGKHRLKVQVKKLINKEMSTEAVREREQN